MCASYGCEEYEADAFALELLGTQKPVDELRCQGLLNAGFECFPDLDYCVLLVPTERPHFPILDYFVVRSCEKISSPVQGNICFDFLNFHIAKFSCFEKKIPESNDVHTCPRLLLSYRV